MKASHLRDELKHVRLIHFALVVVSASMLYLVITAWSDAPQLYGELLSLGDFLSKLQKEGIPLKEIDAEQATRTEDQILLSLQGLTTDKLQWASDRFRSPKPPLKCVWSSAQTGQSKSTSLTEMIDRVTTDRFRFLLPDQLEGDRSAMMVWIAQQLRSENEKGPFIDNFTVSGEAREGPENHAKVTLAVLSWSSVSADENPFGSVFEAHREFAFLNSQLDRFIAGDVADLLASLGKGLKESNRLSQLDSPLDQDRQVAAELPGLVKRPVSRFHRAK